MYEQGRREPSIRTLVELSNIFGVSLDYLITGLDATDRHVQKTAGVLFVLQADISGVPDTILLNETDLEKVMFTLSSSPEL